jgi:hypothetical protein
VWCGLLHDRLIGPFFFSEATTTFISYPDMLESSVCLQFKELQNCPSSKVPCQHTAASLSVYLLISISQTHGLAMLVPFLGQPSQTHGLAMLVPFLGQPDNQISLPVIFSYGDMQKTVRTEL